MKLCRFVLNADPETVRSGIYHDGRYYETDGQNAVGIHDPGSIRILAPVGTPPAVRLFEHFRGPDGTDRLTYSFSHPGRIVGPTTEIDTTSADQGLDFEVRVGALVQEGDPSLGPSEASRMMLGVGILVVLFNADEREILSSAGASLAPASDLATVYGPFLVTPDELTDNRTTDEPTEFTWPVKVMVSGETVYQTVAVPEFSLFDMVSIAARKKPVLPGEMLAWPAFDKPALENTSLGRFLMASDKVSVEIEPLGTLTFRII